ncbi:MAG: AI-2E family transporter [Chitinophagaceae bacterium]|nr:AI-2E family transporter [Chitinophagaceae bacterium]
MYKKFIRSVVLTVLLLIAVLWYFSSIFFYIIISLILCTLLKPFIHKLESINVFHHKIPRFFGIIISFSLIICFAAFFIFLFVPLISEEIEIISSLNFEDIWGNIKQPIANFEKTLVKKKILEKEIFIIESLKHWMLDIIGKINILSTINIVFIFTKNIFITLFAVLFITFFLLLEKGHIRINIINIIPNKYFEVYINTLLTIEKLLESYIKGIALQISLIFVISASLLYIFEIQYPLTIAAFSALLHIVPIVGPIVSTLTALFIGITTSLSMHSSEINFVILKILILYSIVYGLDNILFQPIIFSKSVKAHPLEIFVAIICGGEIAGIEGMIFAIPFYTIIRVMTIAIFRNYREYTIFK